MGSKVITFYSYKGGVGRSMAMANIAVLLSQWGYKTLVIDWDLEAPGLENFYKSHIDLKLAAQKKGLIDLLLLKETNPETQVDKIQWGDYITPVRFDKVSQLDIITAGKRDEEYIKKIKQFDYTGFYANADGGQYLEDLREYWLEQYNFILIDSRTGLTDSSGICSIHMPDILVLLFTPNEQSFYGIKNVAQKAIEGQKQIIYDRFKLRTLPVPSRIEYQETGLLDEWMDKICNQSGEMLEWLPKKEHNLQEYLVTPTQLINQIKIPYRTFYAYGERLAVQERGTHDPQDIGYSYETLAALLANDFQNTDLLINSRDSYVKKAKQEDYTDDSEFRKKIQKEQDEKRTLEKTLLEKEAQTKKRNRIFNTIIGVLLAGLGIIILFATLFKNKNSASVTTEITDSLSSKVNYLDFVNNYSRSSNQYDADVNLEQIKQYYMLEKNYRDSATDIKQKIEDVIGYKFIDLVKSYYNSWPKNGFKATDYFFDTVSRFGSLEMITPFVIQQKMDSIRSIKKIENMIADINSMSYKSDSLGFYVNFVEKGNFVVDTKTEYSGLESAVYVLVGYDFKIRSITYTVLKGIPVGSIDQKPVLELFLCQNSDKVFRAKTSAVVNLLEKTNKYRIYTRNNFSIPADQASPFYITSNEIRYNGTDEMKTAQEIQKLILGETKINIELRPARTTTPNYLSLFICFDEKRNHAIDLRPIYRKDLP